MRLSAYRLGAPLLVAAVALTACGGGSHKAASPSASSSPSVSRSPSGVSTTVGVTVSGKFGTPPTLNVPATPAPAKLTGQVLTPGTGAPLAKGDTLVANYLGQTWAPKNGKPNVFDSSFQRGAPAAFVIGAGKVIPGWDKTLVGQKLGSRVLLIVPPADGYGSGGQPDAGIAGTDTLVFVVDLIAAYKPDASAPGTAVAHLPAGLPRLTNIPGKKPAITGTAGVKTPTGAPTSTLLVAGQGAKIDPAKTLIVQLMQTDLATGKDTQTTWGQGPIAVPAQNVLKVADKLAGHNVGSRVLALLPASPATPGTATQQAQPATPAQILIVDVVGQY